MYDRHREGLLIMYQIDFNKPEHVHFIGIGGISMSGLAEILLDEGFSISGLYHIICLHDKTPLFLFLMTLSYLPENGYAIYCFLL